MTTVCGKTRDGRVCIRPAGHLTDQHHAADGKHWYYCDGEREAAMKRPLVDLVYEDLARREALDRSTQVVLHSQGMDTRETTVFLFGHYDSRGGTSAYEAPTVADAAYRYAVENYWVAPGTLDTDAFTLSDLIESLKSELRAGIRTAGIGDPEQGVALVGDLPDEPTDLELDGTRRVLPIGGKLRVLPVADDQPLEPRWDDDAYSFLFLPDDKTRAPEAWVEAWGRRQ